MISPYNRQLAWILRDFSNVEWKDSAVFLEYPSIIITPNHDLSIGAGPGYIGQEFRLYNNFSNDRDVFVMRNRNIKTLAVNDNVDKLVIWARQGDANP